MQVRIDASDDISDAWALEKIEVTCNCDWYGGVFEYGNWLSMALPKADLWKYRSPGVYKISVFTNTTEANAMFDGDVYIKMTGVYGVTDELMLRNETTVRARVGT